MLLLLLMFSLPTDFVQTFVDFFTIFLVTIPSKFITEALDGGILLTVWNTFFGNSNVIELMVILAFILGVYVMLTKSQSKNRRGML